MDSAKIFIDTDNEITFILEKILASKSDRVCLVIPDRASLFTSISGLKLIKRVIDKSSKLLVLVTLDSNGASLAGKAGLHVVSRVGEVTEPMWEKILKSKFDVMKKESKKIYYTPQIEKITEDSIARNVSKKESSAVELATEIVNETAEEHASEISLEDTLKQEIPQVRIQVNDLEIKKEKVDTWKREQEEIESNKSENLNINNFDSSTDLPPNAIPLESSNDSSTPRRKFSHEKVNSEIIDLKNEAKYEKKVEEIPDKPTRMRKNPLQSGEIGNLTFSVGKDINDEKKK